LRKKVHPGDLAGGFSDLKMSWFLYCAGAATVWEILKFKRGPGQTIGQTGEV